MPKSPLTPCKIHNATEGTFEVVPVIMVSIIKNCARCGGDHTNVMFKSFAKKPQRYTHFGICPTTQEPILMISTPDKPKRKRK